jgi:t-SNARE complex subunit (syntaxin)
MSDPQNDPSGNTEAFRAFVHSAADTEATARPRRWIAVAVVAAVVVVVAVVVIVLTG